MGGGGRPVVAAAGDSHRGCQNSTSKTRKIAARKQSFEKETGGNFVTSNGACGLATDGSHRCTKNSGGTKLFRRFPVFWLVVSLSLPLCSWPATRCDGPKWKMNSGDLDTAPTAHLRYLRRPLPHSRNSPSLSWRFLFESFLSATSGSGTTTWWCGRPWTAKMSAVFRVSSWWLSREEEAWKNSGGRDRRGFKPHAQIQVFSIWQE